jgi:hypothetical protein
MGYKLKISGVTYFASIHEDGTIEYDPPLPQSVIDKSKEKLMDMLESMTAPGTRTDTDFHKGRGSILDQCDGDYNIAKNLVQQSIKRGYTPGANDVYIGQIANGTGDPSAWFKPGEGRSELKKRLIEKGMGCEAPGLSVAPREYVEKESPKLSNKLTNELAGKYRQSGEAEGMSDTELKSMVVKRHGMQD